MSTAWLLQWGTRYQSMPRLFGVDKEPLPNVQSFRHPSGDFAVLDGYLARSSGTNQEPRCDAEHLVQMCRRRGEKILETLSGSFLAVYWNATRQRLSVVRDATGQQTAYFCWRSGTLLISPCLETLFERRSAKDRVGDGILRLLPRFTRMHRTGRHARFVFAGNI